MDHSENFKFLKEKAKYIIGLKLGALAISFSKMAEKPAFASKFLENFFETPFDHECFSMKLCVDLYVREQYSKCENICKIALQSESQQKTRFFPIILQLCAYLYAKVIKNKK